MPAPFWISLIHYAVSLTGTVESTFLMGIILMKTPPHMRSYSVLLMSLTASQMITCFSSCILFARLIPVGTSLVAAVNGPIGFVGTDQFCYYLWFFMLHGHGHFIVMLTVCFLYRYYIMFKPTPKILTLIVIVFAVYLPTLLLLGTSALAPISTQTFIRELLRDNRPSYEFNEGQLFFGIENVLLPQFLTGFLWITTNTFPCYTVILIAGRKIYTALGANKIHMSESTKSSHREIIKGLLIQSCLPAFYCFSIYSYALGQFEILNTPLLEYSTHMFGELTVSCAPFVTLFFVKPYRMTVLSIFRRMIDNDRRNSPHASKATSISIRAVT